LRYIFPKNISLLLIIIHSNFSDRKVNLVGTWGGGVKIKHFPTVFKKIEKNKNKVTEKREILRKTNFRQKRKFNFTVNQKIITVST